MTQHDPNLAQAAEGKTNRNDLIIISLPRSGTNFYCECLNAIPQVAAFYEFFGDQGVFGLAGNAQMHERLSKHFGRTIEEENDPELLEAVKSQPATYLNIFSAIAAGTGSRLFSLKVFPQQVEMSKLRVALSGDHKRVVFITRSRLDCYISFQKALATQTWREADTTDQRPTIDIHAFLEWCEQSDVWYRRLLKHAREEGLDYRIVSYEADICCPKEVLMEKQILMLKSFGLDFRMPIDVRPQSFFKQDKANNPFEKIANGAELEAALEAEASWPMPSENRSSMSLPRAHKSERFSDTARHAACPEPDR